MDFDIEATVVDLDEVSSAATPAPVEPVKVAPKVQAPVREVLDRLTEPVVILSEQWKTLFANAAAKKLLRNGLDRRLETHLRTRPDQANLSQVHFKLPTGFDLVLRIAVQPIEWMGEKAVQAGLADVTPYIARMSQLQRQLTEQRKAMTHLTGHPHPEPDEVQNLISRLKQLEEEASSAKAAHVADLSEARAAWDAERAALTEALTQFKKRLEDENARQNAAQKALEEERDALARELAELTESKKLVETESARGKEDQQTLENERDALAQELEALRRRASVESNELEQARQKMQSLQQAVDEAMKAREGIEADKADLAAKCADMSRRLSEQDQTTKEDENRQLELIAENERLKSRLNKELDAAVKKLAEASTEAQDLRTKLEAAEERGAGSVRDAEERLAEMEAQLGSMRTVQARVAELESLNASLRKEMAAIEEARSQSDETRGANERNERRELHAQLDALQMELAETHARRQELELAAQTRATAEMEAMLELESEKARAHTLEEHNAELLNDLISMKRASNETMAKLKAEAETRRKMISEMETLRHDLREATENAEQSRRQLESMKARTATAISERDTAIGEMTVRISALESKADSEEKAKLALEEELKERAKAAKSLQATVESIIIERDEARKACTEQESLVAELRGKIEAQTSSENSLLARTAELEHALEDNRKFWEEQERQSRIQLQTEVAAREAFSEEAHRLRSDLKEISEAEAASNQKLAAAAAVEADLRRTLGAEAKHRLEAEKQAGLAAASVKELQDKLQLAAREREAFERSLSEAAQKEADWTEQKKALEERLEEADRSHADLQKSLETKAELEQRLSDATSCAADMRREIEVEAKHRQEAEKQAETSAAALKEVQKNLERVAKKRQELESALHEASAKEAGWADQKKTLEGRADELAEAVKSAENAQAALAHQLAEREKVIEHSQSKIKALQAKADSAHEEARTLREQLADAMQAQRDGLQERKRLEKEWTKTEVSLRHEIDAGQAECSRLKKDCAAARDAAVVFEEETAKRAKQCEALESELKDLRAELSCKEKSEREQAEALALEQKKSKAANEELHNALKTLKEMKAAEGCLRDEHEAAIRAAAERFAVLEGQLQSALAESAQANDAVRARDAEIDRLMNERETLMEEAQNATAQSDELRAKAGRALERAETIELELAQSRERLAEAEQAAQDLERVREESSSLVKKCDELADTLDKTRQEMAKVQSDREKTELDHERTLKELHELRSGMEQEEAAESETQRKLEQAATELGELQEKLGSDAEARARAEAEVKRLQEELDGLRQMAGAESQTQIEAQLSEKIRELQEVREQLDSRTFELLNATAAYHRRGQKAMKLRWMASAYKRKCEILEKHIKSRSNEQTQLVALLEAQISRRKEAESEAARLRKKVEEHQDEAGSDLDAETIAELRREIMPGKKAASSGAGGNGKTQVEAKAIANLNALRKRVSSVPAVDIDA